MRYTNSIKKQIILAAIITTIIAGSVVAVAMLQSPSASEPIIFAEAQQQASHQTNLPRCLELSSQDVPGQAREDISKVVGVKLTDVPSGIAYAVFFGTYDKQKANGTIVYDGKSGAYNFTVEQTGVTKNGGWELSEFNACDPGLFTR